MKISTKKLKTVLDVLTVVGMDPDIVPTEAGWDIKVIDAARVSMAHIAVSKDIFTDYEVWEKFALDVNAMNKVMKSVGDETEIKMQSGKLDVISDRLIQHLGIPIVSDAIPRVPDIQNVTATVMVDVEPLKRLLKASDDMDHCRMITNGEGIRFLTISEKNTAEISVPKDECISVEGEAKSSYPLDYLKKFIGIIPKGEIPEFRYSDDFPLTVEFGDKDLKVTWLVAPRIEEGEE